ncbi:LysE family translocator [Nocardia sp. AG03]|uniref:LysE family translocator n=1 Tax=Nocardia sp. AG03 TaxID=3025312 RepID=UPI00241840D9|nr:LysE family translocator [Nocardia sp. AG03]
MFAAVLSFTLASVVLVLLPGPDTLVVVRGLVRGGRAAGIRTAAGVLCGLAVWVGAAVLGLSALLRASEIGYDVLKLVGACYLVWIGVLFVSFLPGFVPDGYSPVWTTLGLGALYIALTALYCAALVVAAGSISSWMRTTRIRRRIDAITGTVLIGFGVRLATES